MISGHDHLSELMKAFIVIDQEIWGLFFFKLPVHFDQWHSPPFKNCNNI